MKSLTSASFHLSRFTLVETSPVNEVQAKFYEENMHRQNNFEQANLENLCQHECAAYKSGR